MPAHSTLTGADLHENKGVSSASNNTVASATGGATVWRKVNANMLDTTSIFGTNYQYLNVTIPDISVATNMYVPVPFAATLVAVYASISGAIATANNTLTIYNDANASMGTISVLFSGSGAGDTYSLSPASNNTFSAGDAVRVRTNAASTNSVSCTFTLKFQLTA